MSSNEENSQLLAGSMAAVAAQWLAQLTPAQARAARAGGPGDPAGDRERHRWFYTPTQHGGLALQAQRPAQRALAMRLLRLGLSAEGYATVCAVIGLENVLEAYEGGTRTWGRERGRDPGDYWVKVFGDPEASDWGWRFGGHHVSINVLVLDGEVVSTTPCFIGADPASVPLLGGGELSPLGATERLARDLLTSLDPDQLSIARIHERAPSDIIGGNRVRIADGDQMIHMHDERLWGRAFEDRALRQLLVDIDQRAEAGSGYTADDHRQLSLTRSPRGVAGRDLDGGQRVLLRLLVDSFVRRGPEQLWTEPSPADLDELHFAWAGAAEEGRPHYFRLQAGSWLLVEYDNTQREANHAHSVWRDPSRDFGLNPLREHRRRTLR